MGKRRIREEILSRRDREPEDIRRKKSRKIKKRLFSLKEFKKAHTILFYYSKGSEVETKEMMKEVLRKGKRVLLPKVREREIYLGEIKDLEKDVEKGSFGILEPKKTSKRATPKGINLVILPGIVFDLKGERIGYGEGYYDHFLKKIPKRILLIGLAYDFQIVSSLPGKRHDKRVGKVITEGRILQPPVQDPEDPSGSEGQRRKRKLTDAKKKLQPQKRKTLKKNAKTKYSLFNVNCSMSIITFPDEIGVKGGDRWP